MNTPAPLDQSPGLLSKSSKLRTAILRKVPNLQRLPIDDLLIMPGHNHQGSESVWEMSHAESLHYWQLMVVHLNDLYPGVVQGGFDLLPTSLNEANPEPGSRRLGKEFTEWGQKFVQWFDAFETALAKRQAAAIEMDRIEQYHRVLSENARDRSPSRTSKGTRRTSENRTLAEDGVDILSAAFTETTTTGAHSLLTILQSAWSKLAGSVAGPAEADGSPV